jgi:hypothetical protein
MARSGDFGAVEAELDPEPDATPGERCEPKTDSVRNTVRTAKAVAKIRSIGFVKYLRNIFKYGPLKLPHSLSTP